MEHTEILEHVYAQAANKLDMEGGQPLAIGLSPDEISLLETIAGRAESNKGVLAVLVTSLTHKIFNPKQDTRQHQSSLPGGYSGRTRDTRFVTPFMKDKRFPAMAESGWLTRSLEQNHPYDLNYPGRITPSRIKRAFLQLLDNIETEQKDLKKYLCYLFQLLIALREKHEIALAKPTGINIDSILHLLERHISHGYSVTGAARLPVLAVYSVYECMIAEMDRFRGKRLQPLREHTTADVRAGSIGDIEIVDEESGNLFEAVEVKHGIKITKQVIDDAFDKFKTHPVGRFYIVSTGGLAEDECDQMRRRIGELRNLHGCQVIINGVIPSLKYYLRLLKDPNTVVEKYVENLMKDSAVKFEHRNAWNQIVGGSDDTRTEF